MCKTEGFDVVFFAKWCVDIECKFLCTNLDVVVSTGSRLHRKIKHVEGGQNGVPGVGRNRPDAVKIPGILVRKAGTLNCTGFVGGKSTTDYNYVSTF